MGVLDEVFAQLGTKTVDLAGVEVTVRPLSRADELRVMRAKSRPKVAYISHPLKGSGAEPIADLDDPQYVARASAWNAWAEAAMISVAIGEVTVGATDAEIIAAGEAVLAKLTTSQITKLSEARLGLSSPAKMESDAGN